VVKASVGSLVGEEAAERERALWGPGILIGMGRFVHLFLVW
jgi:hypothetical protein